MAVGGRVEDDALVEVAATGLPAGKLEGVLHHPPDAVQPAALHIVARPGDDLPDGVEVRHVGPGGCSGERGTSGVGKQVQYARLPEPCGGVFLHERRGLAIYKIPVRRLLGEHPDMLERREAEPKRKIEAGNAVGVRASFITDSPLVLHLLQAVPGAAVLLARPGEPGAGGEAHVGEPGPLGLRERRLPQRLRLRALQHILSEPLELKPLA